MKRTLKITGYTLLYGTMALGYIAKMRNDYVTHCKHREHNPCDCDPACVTCLWK